MTDFRQWERREVEGLWLKGHNDVCVMLAESFDGQAFAGRVGKAQGAFAALDNALYWCEETAKGRAYVLGLAQPPAGMSPSDKEFLEERGLA